MSSRSRYRPKPQDLVDLAAASRSAERRNNTLHLLALLGLAAVVATAVIFALSQSERTRECTLESMRTVHVRRAPDYRILSTAECGDIRTGTARIKVVDRNCYSNSIHVGSRYRMTTTGPETWFTPLMQRLTGPLELVYAPPGERCTSDSWYIED